MKNILRKKLYGYFLTLTVVFTLSVLFSGKTVVEKRGNEVFTGEKYETVFLQNEKDSLKFYNGENETEIEKGVFDKLKAFEKLLAYTPFHSLYYAFKK